MHIPSHDSYSSTDHIEVFKGHYACKQHVVLVNAIINHTSHVSVVVLYLIPRYSTLYSHTKIT